MVNRTEAVRELVDVATYHEVSLASSVGIWLQFLPEDTCANCPSRRT